MDGKCTSGGGANAASRWCPLGTRDNCPTTFNPGQEARDRSSVGDACNECVTLPCGTDVDRDGVGDSCDNCPFVASADQFDSDFDGVGDVCTPKSGMELRVMSWSYVNTVSPRCLQCDCSRSMRLLSVFEQALPLHRPLHHPLPAMVWWEPSSSSTALSRNSMCSTPQRDKCHRL